jgi:hypothetical protein
MGNRKKVLGIGIDGVIRDMHSRFDSVYRKAFIKNDALVQMNDNFEYVPESEIGDAEEESLKKLVADKITLPVDTFDLLNHYHFETREKFEEFLEEYSFEIFGMSQAFPRAMDTVNKLQSFGEQTGLFETVLFSKDKRSSRISTYHFLAKAGCKVGCLRFVDEHVGKWDYCDALIDDCPYVFESKPQGKTSIKINREYNVYSDADYSFNSLPEISDGFLNKILTEQQ